MKNEGSGDGGLPGHRLLVVKGRRVVCAYLRNVLVG